VNARWIQNDNQHRHLLIRSPIFNEKSCYTSSCHAHKENEEVLGSLIIKIPLADLDNAVQKSSTEFYLLATFITLLLISVLILFTRKKIKKPLNELIKASEAVANGNTNTRLEIKSNQLDDMRMVSQAFNDMLDNLQTATEELQNWSQQLEYKVQKKIGRIRSGPKWTHTNWKDSISWKIVLISCTWNQ